MPAENPSTASLSGAAADDTAADTAQSKGPTAEQPSTTGDTHFKAAQADIRDPESSDPKTESERKNVDDTGDLDKSENPGKVDGPGPKPIDEVAGERGGDAGKADSKESAGGAGDADDDGPGAQSKGEGTGEQYVKSTGLAADGGDFDATKPGAGREADRKSTSSLTHFPCFSVLSCVDPRRYVLLAKEPWLTNETQVFWRRRALPIHPPPQQQPATRMRERPRRPTRLTLRRRSLV